MVDLWRDFWIRQTGTSQQVAQHHERYYYYILCAMFKRIRYFTLLLKANMKWFRHLLNSSLTGCLLPIQVCFYKCFHQAMAMQLYVFSNVWKGIWVKIFLRSALFGILLCVEWWFLTAVSGPPIGQAFQEEDCFTPDSGIDMLSRYVRKELPVYVA